MKRNKYKPKKKKPDTWVDLDLWLKIKKFDLELLKKINKGE